jgi:hypothetical protein
MTEIKSQAKGGIARAKNLTAEERTEIARKGGKARWGSCDPSLPRVTYKGNLPVGNIILPCYVIEGDNGCVTRVISQRGINQAFTGGYGGGYGVRKLPRFLGVKDINSLISKDLMARILDPIEFNPGSGRSAFGYEATLLPEICEVILDAVKTGVLKDNAKAIIAETLIRGFARVGIIALVDEATGYQEEREKNELNKMLSAYLAEERLKWAQFFPIEFYKQIYKLKGWPWPPVQRNKYTPLVGKYTNDVVYERLPYGVLDKLKELNPTQVHTKRRRWKNTQFLSEDVGQPDLRAHLLQVIALMRASTTWPRFITLLDRALPSGKSYHLSFLEE